MEQLSLHILDLVQNSLEAEATSVSAKIVEDLSNDRLTIQVVDDGRGMSEEICQRVTDPFFTTRKTRHVGLGIPFLQAATQACAGSLTVRSQEGSGTTITAVFQHSHIDRMPLGDMVKTLMVLFLMTEPITFHYSHQIDDRVFEFSTDLFHQLLGPVSFSAREVREWFQRFVVEGEESVQREFTHAKAE